MRRRPTVRTSLNLAEPASWGSGLLVVASGWAAGRGLAVGMDLPHCAAMGFAISGSIFLAVALREKRIAATGGSAR